MSDPKKRFEPTKFVEMPALICSSCGELAMVSRSRDDNQKIEAMCRTRTCQSFSIRVPIDAKIATRLPSGNDYLESLRHYELEPIRELDPK